MPVRIEDDFTAMDFPDAGQSPTGIRHRVFVKGGTDRPPVLVLHELTGLSWQCARLARLVHDAGFRVYVPLLFGSTNTSGSGGRGLANVLRYCLNQEFKFLQANVERPITRWLLALAQRARQDCGGRPVGVIGMCLTGAFGLTLLLDEGLEAVPVVCQPSIPFPLRRSDTGLLERDLPRIGACAAARQLPVRALRFRDDTKCSKERMDHIEGVIGTLQRWDLAGDKHSTLTNELASHAETAAALEDVLGYLTAHLARPGDVRNL